MAVGLTACWLVILVKNNIVQHSKKAVTQRFFGLCVTAFFVCALGG